MNRASPKPHLPAFFVLPVLFLLLGLAVPPCLSASKHNVFVLNQTSNLFGNQVVYISPTAVRIEVDRLHCSIVAHKGDKTLKLVNTSRKIYFERNIEDWHKDLVKLDSFEKFCHQHGIKWRVINRGTIFGVAFEDYILGKQMENNDPINLSLPKDPKKRFVRVASNIPICTEASEVLARSCGIKSFKKAPLNIQEKGKKKTVRTILTTSGCKQKSVPDSIFEVPSSFKKAGSEFEILMDFGGEGDPSTGIEDIIFKSTSGQ